MFKGKTNFEEYMQEETRKRVGITTCRGKSYKEYLLDGARRKGIESRVYKDLLKILILKKYDTRSN